MPDNHSQVSVSRRKQVRRSRLLVSRRLGSRKLANRLGRPGRAMALRSNRPSGGRRLGNRKVASRKAGRCGGRRKVRLRGGLGRLGGRRKLLGLLMGSMLGSRSRLAGPGNRRLGRRSRERLGRARAVRTLAQLPVHKQSVRQALRLPARLEHTLPERLARTLRVVLGLLGGCLVGAGMVGGCLGLVGGLGWWGRLCWLWRLLPRLG